MTTAHIAFWLVLAVVAVLNGVLREMTYGRITSELLGHQLSTLIGILLTGLAFFIWTRRIRVTSMRQALIVGMAGLAMTVAFEFVFGRFVAGDFWTRLFQDYNVLAGRVWPLFLVWLTLLPYLGYRCRPGSDRPG